VTVIIPVAIQFRESITGVDCFSVLA
jgi:hypothetical protein